MYAKIHFSHIVHRSCKQVIYIKVCRNEQFALQKTSE